MLPCLCQALGSSARRCAGVFGEFILETVGEPVANPQKSTYTAQIAHVWRTCSTGRLLHRINIHIHMHVNIHVYIYNVDICILIDTYMRTHTYIYIYMCICMYYLGICVYSILKKDVYQKEIWNHAACGLLPSCQVQSLASAAVERRLWPALARPSLEFLHLSAICLYHGGSLGSPPSVHSIYASVP